MSVTASEFTAPVLARVRGLVALSRHVRDELSGLSQEIANANRIGRLRYGASPFTNIEKEMEALATG